MYKVIILGSGLVGGPMAIDLANDTDKQVTIVDRDEQALIRVAEKAKVNQVVADLSDTEKVKSLIRDHDIVVNAVPGFMGFNTLKAIIESGKNVIDIAFFPEPVLQLDELAKEKNVVVISDIGVAPGMSNLLVGYADYQLDKTDKVVIYVGGLPKVREWPYEYKAVFSPADVLEEYTRPARYVSGGKEIIKPALSEPELIGFEGIGTLEAFNSDGLRSLAKTINAPDMIEKTLRYPGHISIMKIFRDSGFFSKEKMVLNNCEISPLDFTSRLLFPQWKLNEGDEDITVMKIVVEGLKDNKRTIYSYYLLDEYDKVTGVHSMARTTGYTATMALRMVTNGLYSEKGVTVPEFIGRYPDCVKFILEGLEERNIIYRENINIMD
jgi:saccharopine dehydrogenase-like NADP-dependent oxidoreductase